MARYRKKPVEVTAMVWDGTVESASVIIEWILALGERVAAYDDEHGPRLRIETLEGTMYASPGDYVIQGVQGEHYPCKPDIFIATYEPVLVE